MIIKSKTRVATLSDGRIVKIEPFQASSFVAMSKKITAGNRNPDPMEISFGMMSELCEIADGEGQEFQKLSESILDDMYRDDIMKIQNDLMHADIAFDGKKDGEFYIGKLPSGTPVAIRKARGKDMKIGKPASNDRVFMTIATCAKIDGKELDIHDVRLLDGWDFIAIQDFLG